MTAQVARVSTSGIVELRLYRARRGRRDDMAALFDAEVADALEQAGAEVIGQFIDLDRTTGWGLLRGFPDPQARRLGLEAFYDGPYWRTRGPAFNATLADCSNVRLLRPVRDELMLRWTDAPRAPIGAPSPESVALVSILRLARPAASTVYDRWLAPAVGPLGLSSACYETHPEPDSYPRLPVVTGEHALVHIVMLPGDDPARALARQLSAAVPATELAARPEHRLLRPSGRSLLR